ncbi:MAG TPA: MarR family winged helix-turn-helix transcriptional regulator [Fimbriimonadaceae bacterium]|nr:MarR family winged helix-turn-helix transcriptional regulator [Fimbriimonadaceae bacterium]
MASERLSLAPDTLTAQALLLTEVMNVSMEPTLAAHGIKPGTFDLLSAIHAAGPNATQAEIAERIGIKPPSLTEALRGLKHLVDQVPSERDSRVKHLRLTEDGVRALAATIKSIENLSKHIVKGIDKSDLETAIRILKSANDALAKKTSLG